MNDATVRLIQNSREAFKRFSWEQLYQVALALRDELAFRSVDCQPEADALIAALLVHARVEHRRIASGDCTEVACSLLVPDARCIHRSGPRAPAAEES